MLNKILKSWDAVRIIRLLIGIGIIAEGIHSRDTTLIIAGLVVSFLPIFNIGCCCGNSCKVPHSTQNGRNGELQQK